MSIPKDSLRELQMPSRNFISRLHKELAPITKVTSDVPLKYRDDLSTGRKKYWEVTEGFKFYIGKPADDVWVYVNTGFITDGATVPWWLRWALPALGDHTRAVVVHDLLCITETIFVKGIKTKISRRRVDKIMLECLLVTGVAKLKSYVMYGFVRAYSIISGIRSRL